LAAAKERARDERLERAQLSPGVGAERYQARDARRDEQAAGSALIGIVWIERQHQKSKAETE
jgi:hypothetical protein